MSLSKSKFWYSNNCLHFSKHAFLLGKKMIIFVAIHLQINDNAYSLVAHVWHFLIYIFNFDVRSIKDLSISDASNNTYAYGCWKFVFCIAQAIEGSCFFFG